MKSQKKDWTFTKDEEWSIITSNWVQTWPKNSVETFFTKPPSYYSKKLMDNCDIKVPSAPYSAIMQSLGIRRAAIIKRDEKYFVSRDNRNCYFVVFCVAVKNYKIISERRLNVKSAQTYIIPPNKQIDTSASLVNAIWFEIDNTPFWKNILGTSIVVKESQKISDIANLAKMYVDEIYSAKPDSETLKALATLFIKTICKEFVPEENFIKQKYISELIDEIEESPNKEWTLHKVAKKLKINKDTLNKKFEDSCGKTFSKKLLEIRMFAALKTIKNGKTLQETAKKVGYADGRSLAVALKKFFSANVSSLKTDDSARKTM